MIMNISLMAVYIGSRSKKLGLLFFLGQGKDIHTAFLILISGVVFGQEKEEIGRE
jgi:hypothetical protein